jgi:hypothetical protein
MALSERRFVDAVYQVENKRNSRGRVVRHVIYYKCESIFCEWEDSGLVIVVEGSPQLKRPVLLLIRKVNYVYKFETQLD